MRTSIVSKIRRHIAECQALPSARARKRELEFTRGLWSSACRHDYEAGNVAALFEFISGFGEQALSEDFVQSAIAAWRKEYLKHNSAEARDLLLKVGTALAFKKGGGRPRELSFFEAKSREKSRNGQVTTDKRAIAYCDQGSLLLRRAIERLPAAERQNPEKIKELVAVIAEKRFSRGGAPKQEGLRLFLQQVEKDLDFSVTPNSSGNY